MNEDNPHPMDYKATIGRMEPGLSPVDPQIAMASIAISFKQISVMMVSISGALAAINNTMNIAANNIAAMPNYNTELSGIKSNMSRMDMTLRDMNEHISLVVKRMEEVFNEKPDIE